MDRTKQIAQDITSLEQEFLRNVYHSILKQIDIPPSQLVTLMTVYENRKQDNCLSDLSRQMHISNPTVTGLVDRLEKAGYVRRCPNKKDRRVTNIMITKKGEKLTKDFLLNVNKKWNIILSKLKSDDQESFLRIFKNIIEGLNPYEE